MSTLQRILVPIDFSEASICAFHEAVRIARGSGAQLLVTHVYQIPISASLAYAPAVIFEDFDRSVRTIAETRVRAFVEQAHYRGVDSRALVLSGSAEEEIVAAAEENRVDLIVIGTRGHAGASRFLGTGVTARVVADAPCPVLTVRPCPDGSPNPRRVMSPHARTYTEPPALDARPPS